MLFGGYLPFLNLSFHFNTRAVVALGMREDMKQLIRRFSNCSKNHVYGGLGLISLCLSSNPHTNQHLPISQLEETLGGREREKQNQTETKNVILHSFNWPLVMITYSFKLAAIQSLSNTQVVSTKITHDTRCPNFIDLHDTIGKSSCDKEHLSCMLIRAELVPEGAHWNSKALTFSQQGGDQRGPANMCILTICMDPIWNTMGTSCV